MNWTCPFCQRAQAVTDAKFWTSWQAIAIQEHALGAAGVRSTAVACANPDCLEVSLTVTLTGAHKDVYGQITRGSREDTIISRRLRPESRSKPQPDYIPEALREDYYEACLVRDVSPKSAATLARRCLQGMIRDFAGISRKTLFQEIVDLQKAIEDGTAPRDVSLESAQAVDHVRTVGNIGAHMEANVDHIIPVEAGEAQLLIELVESLFDEWYVQRHKRQVRFSELAAVAEAKKLAKDTPPALPAPD